MWPPSLPSPELEHSVIPRESLSCPSHHTHVLSKAEPCIDFSCCFKFCSDKYPPLAQALSPTFEQDSALCREGTNERTSPFSHHHHRHPMGWVASAMGQILPALSLIPPSPLLSLRDFSSGFLPLTSSSPHICFSKSFSLSNIMSRKEGGGVHTAYLTGC